MTSSWSDRVRIGFGSCSNRPRIGIDTSTVFGQFLLDFGVRFPNASVMFPQMGKHGDASEWLVTLVHQGVLDQEK